MPKIVTHPSLDPLLGQLAETTPHALIISGEEGRGSGTLARSLAAQWGTLQATIEPKKKKSEDTYETNLTEGSIVIYDIRKLYELTRGKSITRRVIIIDTHGRPFTTGAQNAFLKLLEEPPVNTSFIIAVHSLDQLLPTIKSRAQIVQLPAITAQQSSDLLDHLKVFDETLRSRLLFIASGRPAELTRLATDTDRYDARVQTVQAARRILEGSPHQRIVEIMRFKDNRQLALQLITDMIHQLEMTYRKRPTIETARLIEALITASDRIKQYGNIPLQLSTVLLR